MKNKIFFSFAAALLLNAAVCYSQQAKPKNIILLIGDGMGLNAVTSSVYYLDNNQFRRFPFTGLVITSSVNQLITDSGAGATAYSSAIRTYNLSIGVDTTGKPMQTLLEFAKSINLSTGIIATKAITDATPAAFYAHVTQRSKQTEIAEFLLNKKVDIAIGGGRNYFLPTELKGDRKDNKNIVDSLKARGYKTPFTYEELKQTNSKDKIIALLDKKHFVKAPERSFSLGDLTGILIDRLKLNKNGFFAMVEGSQIDSGEHDNDLPYTIGELRDFNEAVKAALDFAEKDKHTLVVVVADHETGGLSITGGNFKAPVVSWTTKDHTASMIGVFAYGPGANQFSGIIDNFTIGERLFKLLGKK